MLRPVSLRRTMAAEVSRIGMISRAAGAARATVAGPLSEALDRQHADDQADQHAAAVAEEDRSPAGN